MPRSPNYPSISLPEAIATAQKIYGKERQATMSHEVASTAMGYSALHGPARRKLSALRKYGLLDVSSTTARVSNHAMTILHPKSDAERTAAIREAALRPELYRELAEEEGASDANLIATLIRRGFLPDSAASAVASFRATMSLAGGEATAYDPGESEVANVMEMPEGGGDKLDPRFRGNVGAGSRPQDRDRQPDLMLTWPLPGGVIALVQIRNGPLTPRGVEVLTRHLDLVKETLAESASSLPSSPTAPQPPSERSPVDAQD